MIHARHFARGCVATLGLLGAAGCIHRAPESLVPQDKPHISWEIAFDDTDHFGEKHSCTSVKPLPCEVPSGTADRPVSTSVVIYLHPAAIETTYTGVVEIGFMGDPAKPSRLDVNQKVAERRKSNVPIQASLTGRVSAKPGEYRVTMKIVATTGGQSTTIEDAVTVTIRPPS